MTGLRELKKSQTRQLIADTALELFRRQGFDTVTVDDVAQAAQVSKKTVFNYFATKEDLLFHHLHERDAETLAAVRDRAPGVSVLQSFRQLCLAKAADLAELRRNAGPGSATFYDLLRSTPALQRRSHEHHAELVRSLAAALADESADDPADPVLHTVAWSLIGARRALQRRLRERVASDATDIAIRRAHQRDVDRVFAVLAGGLAGY